MKVNINDILEIEGKRYMIKKRYSIVGPNEQEDNEYLQLEELK